MHSWYGCVEWTEPSSQVNWRLKVLAQFGYSITNRAGAKHSKLNRSSRTRHIGEWMEKRRLRKINLRRGSFYSSDSEPEPECDRSGKGEPESTSTDGAPGSNPSVLTTCGCTGWTGGLTWRREEVPIWEKEVKLGSLIESSRTLLRNVECS